MLTIKEIIINKDTIIKSLKNRNFDVSIIDKLYNLGINRNTLIIEQEELQSKRNILTKEFSLKIKSKTDTTHEKGSLDKIKSKIQELQKKLDTINNDINKDLFSVPNIPCQNTPIGKDENDNVPDKYYLTEKIPTFKVIPHHEIINTLKIVDTKRSAKISGSRFALYQNKGAQLARALISFYLDNNTSRGYNELLTPVLVNSNALFGTGQLPKFSEDLFKIENKDLWLIPTAEVTITNYFANEILDLSKPKSFTGFTECFRSEAGSAGKDIKGIIRLHEFKKVELVKITSKKDQEAEFKKLLDDITFILTSLELPFRKLILCTGDLGFSSEYTIDFEVWLPSENRYLEVSSASKFNDFQAKRLKLRYKDGDQNKYACTMNGSGLPVGRIITTILENCQTEDGHILVPKVLHKYLNFTTI